MWLISFANMKLASGSFLSLHRSVWYQWQIVNYLKQKVETHLKKMCPVNVSNEQVKWIWNQSMNSIKWFFLLGLHVWKKFFSWRIFPVALCITTLVEKKANKMVFQNNIFHSFFCSIVLPVCTQCRHFYAWCIIWKQSTKNPT